MGFSVHFIKLRYYEKATKFEKNLSPVLTKQLFSLSSVKTSGRFSQIFVAFSEKLDFNISIRHFVRHPFLKVWTQQKKIIDQTYVKENWRQQLQDYFLKSWLCL